MKYVWYTDTIVIPDKMTWLNLFHYDGFVNDSYLNVGTLVKDILNSNLLIQTPVKRIN